MLLRQRFGTFTWIKKPEFSVVSCKTQYYLQEYFSLDLQSNENDITKMNFVHGLCLLLCLSDIFWRQVLAENANSDKSILEPSTTSERKVTSVLRDILNQESLVRFSMVQRIQNLVMEVIENKNNSQILKQKLKILTKALNELKTRDNAIETEAIKLKEVLKVMNETMQNKQGLKMDKIREELVLMTNQTSDLKEESRELLAENKRIKKQLEMQNKTNTLLNSSYSALLEEIQQIKNRELDVRNKNRELSAENKFFREQLNDFKNTLKEVNANLYERRFQRIEDSFTVFSQFVNETLDILLQDHKVLNLQVLNISSSLSNVELKLHPRSCYDILKENSSLKEKDGVYDILIDSTSTSVFCDMTTDGGGWTVLQKRIDGSTDFYRTWEEYKHGFGDLKKNYWIGNDAIHALTKIQDQELRVDLQRFSGETAYAEYSTFYIGNEANKYQLTVSGFTGTAGDGLAYHSGERFSTKDQDNDNWSNYDCATSYHGAWWYRSCANSNLNSGYARSAVTGNKYTSWYKWKKKWEALQKTKMMIRHKH